MIVDLGSRRGTKLNHHILKGRQTLCPGDIIKVGDATITVTGTRLAQLSFFRLLVLSKRLTLSICSTSLTSWGRAFKTLRADGYSFASKWFLARGPACCIYVAVLVRLYWKKREHFFFGLLLFFEKKNENLWKCGETLTQSR